MAHGQALDTPTHDDPQLLVQLARKARKGTLAGINFAARKLPVTAQVPSGQATTDQHAAVAIEDQPHRDLQRRSRMARLRTGIRH